MWSGTIGPAPPQRSAAHVQKQAWSGPVTGRYAAKRSQTGLRPPRCAQRLAGSRSGARSGRTAPGSCRTGRARGLSLGGAGSALPGRSCWGKRPVPRGPPAAVPGGACGCTNGLAALGRPSWVRPRPDHHHSPVTELGAREDSPEVGVLVQGGAPGRRRPHPLPRIGLGRLSVFRRCVRPMARPAGGPAARVEGRSAEGPARRGRAPARQRRLPPPRRPVVSGERRVSR
jgi:hypothetical protein